MGNNPHGILAEAEGSKKSNVKDTFLQKECPTAGLEVGSGSGSFYERRWEALHPKGHYTPPASNGGRLILILVRTPWGLRKA